MSSHASRTTALGVFAVVAGFTLAGCSPGQPANGCSSDLASYVDQSLQVISDCIHEGSVLIIQDASPRVAELPSYIDSVGLRGNWRVVNACARDNVLDEETIIEVAVIPIDHEMSEADFVDAVVCDW